MKLVQVRRSAQAFFLLLFIWFCAVATLGDQWWQWRGWPLNWLLQLDPLVALGTLLTTGRLYAGLAWAAVTLALTLFLGRFFCGWLCPFGTLHQLAGWIGRRLKPPGHRIAANRFNPAQLFKYYVLFALLSGASAGLLNQAIRQSAGHPLLLLAVGGVTMAFGWLAARRLGVGRRRLTLGLAAVALISLVLGATLRPNALASALNTGLLDPLPLIHRSVSLLFVSGLGSGGGTNRFYTGAWSIAIVFLLALAANFWVPRFYCRYICPLGALFGVMVRWTPWRVGKQVTDCCGCEKCEEDCEGACEPLGKIHSSECLLCMNCLDKCPQARMTYGSQRSAAGEIGSLGMSRRGFLAATAGVGVGSVSMLSAALDNNWNSGVVRPPGALAEPDFLNRCVKCGQCVRVCPTNVLQLAWLEAGFEGLWTPLLNFRAGTSGCQLNCIACGNICPTSAVRPLCLEEKLGTGAYASNGPVRLGTAFVDRTRCLPWAMDLPCIVCQENCPVSPKAIFLREEFETIREGVRRVKSTRDTLIEVEGVATDRSLGTGDYFVRPENGLASERRAIQDNAGSQFRIAVPFSQPVRAGASIVIEVRLQRPLVDLEHCIGCGVCEHECPVSGTRAIRVTAENETRNTRHALGVGAGPRKQL